MVIVNIFAGLGNQMFQYATARRLAHKLGVDLKLDLYTFDRCQFRKYQLNLFRLPEQVASPVEVEAICGPDELPLLARIVRKVRRVANRRLGYRWGGLVPEKHFHFDPAILNLPDNVYLHGLWQSEKYFADIPEIVREDFTLKEAPTGKNLALVDEMQAADQAVSLHVRRGDYVTDAHSNQSHGVCGPEYYHRAIDYMAARLPRARFFVFSDDIPWARENLRLPTPGTFIDHNGPDHGIQDMRLMSHSRHHIIANSSFSWWGAWLNPRADKMVCAPQQWFGREAKVKRQARDILPASWVAL